MLVPPPQRVATAPSSDHHSCRPSARHRQLAFPGMPHDNAHSTRRVRNASTAHACVDFPPLTRVPGVRETGVLDERYEETHVVPIRQYFASFAMPEPR